MADRRRTLFFRILVIFGARKDSESPNICKCYELPRHPASRDEGKHQYEISYCIAMKKCVVAGESYIEIVIFGLFSLVK